MAEVRGEVRAGDAAAAAASLPRRMRSFPAPFMLVLAIVVTGPIAGAVIEALIRRALGQAPTENYLGCIVGFSAALVVAWRIYTPAARWQYRRRYVKHGGALNHAVALTTTDQGLTYAHGCVTRSAPWTALNELILAKDYWIFIVQAEAWIIPRRFFSGAAEERALIDEAWRHMSEEAQERSVRVTSYLQVQRAETKTASE